MTDAKKLKRGERARERKPTPPQRDKHAEMRELIARTKASAEAQAQRDFEISQASESLPMRSPAIWHVHGPDH